jgi:hypothetical protein
LRYGASVTARARCLALFVAGTVACHGSVQKQTPDAAIAVAGEWESAREAARAVLESHCGECHDPGSPSALPGALRVYDLGAVEWSARMSPAQLRDAYGRLGSSVVPTRGDAEALEMHVSDAERATFLRFVELSEQRQSRDR